MAFSFINGNATNTAAGTGTTSATNMTGANLLVFAGYWFSTHTPSDSLGNTYTSIINVSPDGNIFTEAWYSPTPSVSSSMTFTFAANNASFAVAGYSGAATSSVLDASTSSHTTLSGSSIQPGSITPANNNSLAVGVVGIDDGTTGLSSFTISPGTIAASNPPSAGQWQGCALGHSIQTTATAFNPTLAGWTSGSRNAALAFAFNAASSGVTVAATGVSATGSVGSVTPSTAVPATGVSVTGAVGTVTPSTTVALTGVSATGLVGNVAIAGDVTIAVTGVSATGQVGDVTAGVPATGGHFIPLTKKQLQELKKRERKERQAWENREQARKADAESITQSIRETIHPEKLATINTSNAVEDDDDEDIELILLNS